MQNVIWHNPKVIPIPKMRYVLVSINLKGTRVVCEAFCGWLSWHMHTLHGNFKLREVEAWAEMPKPFEEVSG